MAEIDARGCVITIDYAYCKQLYSASQQPFRSIHTCSRTIWKLWLFRRIRSFWRMMTVMIFLVSMLCSCGFHPACEDKHFLFQTIYLGNIAVFQLFCCQCPCKFKFFFPLEIAAENEINEFSCCKFCVQWQESCAFFLLWEKNEKESQRNWNSRMKMS